MYGGDIRAVAEPSPLTPAAGAADAITATRSDACSPTRIDAPERSAGNRAKTMTSTPEVVHRACASANAIAVRGCHRFRTARADGT